MFWWMFCQGSLPDTRPGDPGEISKTFGGILQFVCTPGIFSYAEKVFTLNLSNPGVLMLCPINKLSVRFLEHNRTP